MHDLFLLMQCSDQRENNSKYKSCKLKFVSFQTYFLFGSIPKIFFIWFNSKNIFFLFGSIPKIFFFLFGSIPKIFFFFYLVRFQKYFYLEHGIILLNCIFPIEEGFS